MWRIELLGTLKANREGQSLVRFRTRRVASLLAYLAYFGQRVHSRDEVAAMLWPDADIAVSRRNLRQALSSLRHALEPAPIPFGSVIQSIHDGIQLNPETVSTDVSDFENWIEQGRRATPPELAIERLTRAVHEYKGDLLPGFNDEWIWSERLRLEDLYLSALRRLSSHSEPDEAIAHLRLGLVREPFNEHWHLELIKRYLEMDRPEKALEQFSELESSLGESFGQAPSSESQRLARRAENLLGLEGRTDRHYTKPEMPPKKTEQRVSLPFFANRYFGRSREISLICQSFESARSRLVTILGPAGVGKTRLSIQCATSMANDHGWDVWFVPLADRSNAAEVIEAVIAAMDSKHSSSSSEVNRILELTAGRPTLLVLDNLEQIAEDAGTYVAQILERVPNVCCLTSSRHALQIVGEQVIAIDPLPLPSDQERTLADLAQNPSIQLFIDRCQAIRPDLQLNDRNAEAITTLCTRLDGLPLAIEIVAGLSSSFSPSQMLHHLPLKTTGLTSRRRDVPARHKSLRAAIDWSYQSLSLELQTLFRQLSVFRGGFTLQAATAICFSDQAKGRLAVEECLAALQSLQERSLVRSEPAEENSAPRFYVLVAFREYAEEQISNDELLALRERHAEFFVNCTPPNRPFESTEEQTAQHLAIEQDHDNFTTAVEFSWDQGNFERCVHLLSILSLRWLSRGPKATERRLIKLIANGPELKLLEPELQVRAHRMLGTTYIRSGEYSSAYEACAMAVKIAIENQDDHLLATCYSGLSVCASYLGQLEESLGLNQKVLELAGADNLVLAERSYLGMGSVYWNLGRLDEARAIFEKARTISERQRGGEPDALIAVNQARVALDLGLFSESLRLAHEAMRISRRLQDDFTLSVALMVVSRYHLLTGNIEAAIASNLQALEMFKKSDFLFFILQCLRSQALLWIESGRFEEAATLLGATSEVVYTYRQLDLKDQETALVKLRKSLSKQAFESAWARGLAMDRSEAIRFVSSSTNVAADLLTDC